MWLAFSILAGIFYTLSGLVTRLILKDQKDSWAFSFFFSAIGALVCLPFVVADIKLPASIFSWIMMIAIGLLVVSHNWLNFKSSNYIEASVSGTITKLRITWTFVLGILLLNEHFSWAKVLGTVFAILAGWVLISKFKKPKSLKGIIYALSATFFYAAVAVCSKFLLSNFNSASLTFFIFFISMCLNYLIMPNAKERIKTLIQSDGKNVAIACVLGGLANLSMNQAFSLGEISRVVVVIEAFLIATLVGEHFWLKEKDHVGTKILAVVLAVAGVILIALK